MKPLHFIKILTAKRVLNYLKVVFSFSFSVLLKKPYVWGKPVGISIEPSALCNLRCPECPTGKLSLTRNTGLLSFDNFVKYLAEFENELMWLTLYFQGEPFLNPDFFKMIFFAKSKRIFVSTSTNAHFLNRENCIKIIKSGLDRLIISVDGADAETYSKYRTNGDFNQVMSGVETLVKCKKELNSSSPEVQIQFLVFRYNEHQISEIKKMVAITGADKLVLKSAQIYNYHSAAELIPTVEKYSRYKKSPQGTYVLKRKIRNRCFRAWKSIVITWNGDVVPCCFDKNAEYVYGNLNNHPYSVISKSKSMMNFRKSILSNRNSIPICTNCTE